MQPKTNKSKDSMENIQVREMTAKEAITYVSKMVKIQYLASLMEGTRKSNQIFLSCAKNELLVHGVPYEFTPGLTQKLAGAIRTVGLQLLDVRILPTPQTEEEYPLCFGDDYVSKFRNLRKAVCLPYIFIDCMGKTMKWQLIHISDSHDRYYNTFKPEDLAQINRVIQSIAVSLLSIKIV